LPQVSSRRRWIKESAKTKNSKTKEKQPNSKQRGCKKKLRLEGKTMTEEEEKTLCII
jgi:hypothetical protein